MHLDNLLVVHSNDSQGELPLPCSDHACSITTRQLFEFISIFWVMVPQFNISKQFTMSNE